MAQAQSTNKPMTRNLPLRTSWSSVFLCIECKVLEPYRRGSRPDGNSTVPKQEMANSRRSLELTELQTENVQRLPLRIMGSLLLAEL